MKRQLTWFQELLDGRSLAFHWGRPIWKKMRRIKREILTCSLSRMYDTIKVLDEKHHEHAFGSLGGDFSVRTRSWGQVPPGSAKDHGECRRWTHRHDHSFVSKRYTRPKTIAGCSNLDKKPKRMHNTCHSPVFESSYFFFPDRPLPSRSSWNHVSCLGV